MFVCVEVVCVCVYAGCLCVDRCVCVCALPPCVCRSGVWLPPPHPRRHHPTVRLLVGGPLLVSAPVRPRGWLHAHGVPAHTRQRDALRRTGPALPACPRVFVGVSLISPCTRVVVLELFVRVSVCCPHSFVPPRHCVPRVLPQPNAPSVNFWWLLYELNREMYSASARIDSPHHWESKHYQWITNRRGVLYWAVDDKARFEDRAIVSVFVCVSV